MRLSPVCGVSTKPSELSKIAAAAGALFGSFLLFCERKMASRQAVAQEQREARNPNFSAAFAGSSADTLFVSFHFLRLASITPQRSDWMQSRRKIFDSGRNCSTRSKRSPASLRYRLFESKFDRNSDFETPVAVFILQVELYAVTSGLATVGGIEQPESINNAFVDGVFGHLIVAVSEIETSLCRRERPRGQ